MYEAACEPYGKCDVDQRSFKGYLSRWLAATAIMAPFTSDTIMGYLQNSAAYAASSCVGGHDGVTCGFRWSEKGKWDGNFGIGEQMSALEVIQNLLVHEKSGPLTANSGGTSKGNPSAGLTTTQTTNADAILLPTTTGDKIGAGFLTTLCLAMVLGGTYWLIV